MGAPVRILHLDDNPADAELVALTLEAEQERFPATLTYVQTKDQYLAALARKDFDIILSDFRMPGYDGDDALASARSMCPDVPFILVTGELGEEFAVERLQRGVTDYVLKDRIFRLVPAIKRGLTEAENSRKRVESDEALRRSEERFAATFMGSPIPLSISRVRDGMVLEVNDALLKLYGADRDEVVGKTTFALGIWPDLRERARILEIIERKGKIYESETRLRSRSLGERHVLVTVTLLKIGDEPMVLSILNDITEQKRMEESLKESEARFRTMADTTPVMLWVTDARGDIEMVNRAWEEFFGVREAQVKPPGTWRVLVHPEDRQAYVDAYMKAVETRSPFIAKARVKHASGEWRWVHSVSVPRIAPDGAFLGHVGSSPDITECTSALQKANQEMEAFGSSVAQDLMAPLGLIKRCADLLIREGGANLAGKYREYLATIQHQTGYMEELIQKLRR